LSSCPLDNYEDTTNTIFIKKGLKTWSKTSQKVPCFRGRIFMKSDMQERKFSLQEETLDNLEDVSKTFGITEATIIRIAIYHGIRKMLAGYRPDQLAINGSIKKKVVAMPVDAWNVLDRMIEQVKKLTPEYKMPSIGKLINIFINLELQQFIYYCDPEAYLNSNYYTLYSQEDKEDVEILNPEKLQVNHTSQSASGNTINKEITISVPEELYNEVCLLEEMAGINADQAWRFFLNRGLLDEYYGTQIDTIQTDKDIIDEINKLGLPRQKVFTLLSLLLKNKRITWHREI